MKANPVDLPPEELLTSAMPKLIKFVGLKEAAKKVKTREDKLLYWAKHGDISLYTRIPDGYVAKITNRSGGKSLFADDTRQQEVPVLLGLKPSACKKLLETGIAHAASFPFAICAQQEEHFHERATHTMLRKQLLGSENPSPKSIRWSLRKVPPIPLPYQESLEDPDKYWVIVVAQAFHSNLTTTQIHDNDICELTLRPADVLMFDDDIDAILHPERWESLPTNIQPLYCKADSQVASSRETGAKRDAKKPHGNKIRFEMRRQKIAQAALDEARKQPTQCYDFASWSEQLWDLRDTVFDGIKPKPGWRALKTILRERFKFDEKKTPQWK